LAKANFNTAENVLKSGPMKASVVINTYNRADYLRNAIVSIAAQSYAEIELIVVNGPSTDNTEDVLNTLAGDGICIKRANCPNRNLSESRNVGISQASGDVVLFIDDDAVAHREWVGRLMARYSDSSVGAAGGFTFDHTGMAYQCRYTVCDKLGNAHFFDTLDPGPLLEATSDFFFPSLLGTNCSFSRRVLEHIGGFDEVFEYMLDETDVCARVIENSKVVITVPNAYVFHKYAPSDTRTHERIPRSLKAPARSKVYFCFKHSTSYPEGSTLEVIAEIERYRRDIEFSNKWFLDHGKISPAHYSRLCQELTAGIADGLRIGFSGTVSGFSATSPITSRAVDSLPVTFTRVQGRPAPERVLKIYLVSQGYPPADTAGIARWTHECAHELSARGHEVHVITRSQGNAHHVDFREGVWIHSIIDAFDDDFTSTSPVVLPPSVVRRATAVLREIQRSEPIWGVEGILCCAHLNKPVILSLHTTYKIALQFKPEWRTNLQYKARHVDKVIAAEAWLLENSCAILANSQQVIEEIDEHYGGVLARRAGCVTTIWHGVGAPVAPQLKDAVIEAASVRKLQVLFVGRLEERKGPDQLLSALAQIPSLLGQIEVSFVGSSGNADDPYWLKIIQQAESLKRRNPRLSLNFLGYVPDKRLQELYASADVFVAPSRFESFGLVLIEAMRHGVPLIACDVGGMREIISDGSDGYLIRPEDIVQLADRLRLLIENRETRQKIGECARQTYESRFTARAMAESIEKMFTALTQGVVNE
jgi:glycogen synthase